MPTYPAATTPKNGVVSSVRVCIESTQIDCDPTASNESRSERDDRGRVRGGPRGTGEGDRQQAPDEHSQREHHHGTGQEAPPDLQRRPQQPADRLRTASAERRSRWMRPALSSTVPA